ncbi:MAG: amino-acid N-acetyltransferase [Spirochaetaceae bacterium]|nr:amino-acid N-acetyltransferase [Spirochaetaceae bacterium]
MAVSDIREQVDLIREVFAYTERFRGSIFVIRISNEIIDHPNFPQHARDLALLHNAGIRIVIVPGARKRIDEVLGRYGVEKRFVDDIRVSDPESMDLIKMAAFDVAHRVMTALSGHKITAVIGNWVRARSRGVLDGTDFGRTGLVDRVRVEAVSRSLEQGHVPIFPCVGHNDSGDPFNLSSDELAGTIAGSLNARKLFLLSEDPVMCTPEWTVPDGVDILEDGRIFRMTPGAVTDLIKLNPDKPGRPDLETAASACREGINRAHILDGRQAGVLLKEIFSNLGMGTMVFADAYERLRPMESSDVPGILEIMQPLIAEGVLVDRSREDLEDKQDDYWVYAMDGVVHGCAALHFWNDRSAEIAGVAVDPRYAQLGIGVKLITRLSEKAVEDGFRQIFVLTTRTADWFLARGFKEGSVADIPTERREDYDSRRNSRVLVKNLIEDMTGN